MDTDKKAQAVRVLLADENPIFATGCALALARFGIEVVEEVRTPADTVGRYDVLKPDVVLIDACLGGKNGGLQAAREIILAHPTARIVMLGHDSLDAIYRESYRLGACAFLTKNHGPEDLAKAVNRASVGSLFFMPEVAEHLASVKIRGDDCPHELLDGREFEIFRRMTLGQTNQEIARALDLSLKSISNHSMNIKHKFGTDRIAELTRIAVRHGVIEA